MAMPIDELTIEAAGRVFADPGAYTDEAFFHRACALLRREAPIALVEAEGFPPFYALTRHADVMEAERNPEVFRNLPQPVLMETERERVVRQAGDLATLVHMDDPDHRKYRALTADWFQPSSLARLEGRVAELARRAVDRMAALGEECDFAVDIATPMPLEVILSILGLPEADYPKMLQLTRELFQGDDPEFARGSTFEEFMTVMYDFFQYFGALVDERRARPTEDLASVIANAVVDGEPIWPFQQISYYVIIATAGHDTTSFTMTGGLQALLEHPDELVPRLRWIEPAGPAQRSRSIFVGGHKHLPIRYEID